MALGRGKHVTTANPTINNAISVAKLILIPHFRDLVTVVQLHSELLSYTDWISKGLTRRVMSPPNQVENHTNSCALKQHETDLSRQRKYILNAHYARKTVWNLYHRLNGSGSVSRFSLKYFLEGFEFEGFAEEREPCWNMRIAESRQKNKADTGC